MRVIGYLEEVTDMKVTFFEQGLRYSIKFEDGLYEQTYKFRQGEGMSNLKELKALVDQPFLEAVRTQFEQMREQVSGLLSRQFPAQDETEAIFII